jgi:hypothetical protein
VSVARRFCVGLALLCLGVGLFGGEASAAVPEGPKIEALLGKVAAQTAVQFIRNGKVYDAATAAKFLRGKWERQKSEVTTVSDFIGKIATKSSTSGEPYHIRFKDGREIECAQFLKDLLTTP